MLKAISILGTTVLGIIGILDWLDISYTKVLKYIKDIYLNSINFDYIFWLNSLNINSNYIYITLFILLSLFLLKKTKVISSNHCSRIKFIIFLKIFSPMKSYKLLKALHKLEHLMIKQKRLLEENFNNYTKYKEEINIQKIKLKNLTQAIDNEKGINILNKIKEDYRKEEDKLEIYRKNKIIAFEKDNKELIIITIRSILEEYQKIFNLFSIDVSINIKRFITYKKLKTYIRIPSIYETAKAEKSNEYIRDEQEEFSLIYNKSIEDLIAYDSKLSNFSVNSFYNDVTSLKNNRYKICNNLKKAKKKKEFYSSSKGYSKYYNSLAIFLISDKVDTNDDKIENSIGLLIFDTYKTHAFSQTRIKELGGYLTHKLYIFLDNYNIYLGSPKHETDIKNRKRKNRIKKKK